MWGLRLNPALVSFCSTPRVGGSKMLQGLSGAAQPQRQVSLLLLLANRGGGGGAPVAASSGASGGPVRRGPTTNLSLSSPALSISLPCPVLATTCGLIAIQGMLPALLDAGRLSRLRELASHDPIAPGIEGRWPSEGVKLVRWA